MTPTWPKIQLKPCIVAKPIFLMKLLNLALVQTAPIFTTCNVELTAMTAASLGLEMTQESGILTRPYADARLKKFARLSSVIAVLLLTQVFVELTARVQHVLGSN
jgi:hypothetical protein